MGEYSVSLHVLRGKEVISLDLLIAPMRSMRMRPVAAQWRIQARWGSTTR